MSGTLSFIHTVYWGLIEKHEEPALSSATVLRAIGRARVSVLDVTLTTLAVVYMRVRSGVVEENASALRVHERKQGLDWQQAGVESEREKHGLGREQTEFESERRKDRPNFSTRALVSTLHALR